MSAGAEAPTAVDAGFSGAIGLARREITPPLDVTTRSWGPSVNQFSAGVHRPLTLTAVAFVARGQAPLVLVAADLGWWRTPEDERHIRQGLLEELGAGEDRVLVHLSHTHAGPSSSITDGDTAGTAYLGTVRAAAAAAAREAVERAEPATLTCATGRSSLAANRDLLHAGRYVVGFNPAAAADDTLLVGRIAATGGRVLGVLYNYACHPTTLAWQNTLVSPDFVGAAREVIESATHGALSAFLQGASGELAPRHQYVGDTGVADRHGRSLGHAVLAALEGLPPPGSSLAFGGIVESGATLGMWAPEPSHPPAALAVEQLAVELELKGLPTVDELARRWEGIDPNSLAERLRRARVVRAVYGDGPTHQFPVWVWRLGTCVIVAYAGEAYSHLQVELRRRHPGEAVFVLNVTNTGSSAYLPDDATYEHDIYQVWQTPYARGSLERVIEAADRAIVELLGGA